MKVCPKCMQQNADQARFCQVCQSPFDAAPLVCARGHNLDPTWTECPYCRAEASNAAPAPPSAAAGRPKTMVEDPSAAPFGDPRRPMAPPPPPPVPQMPPAAGAPPPAARRGKTVFLAPQQTEMEGQPVPRAVERKIVGVLVTYSWRPEGQLFAVREGRNLIGRGNECEIQVPEDNTLSNVSSHITFRKAFTIGDMVSMSGTDLNGVPIEEQFVPLVSGAKIRTGSTHWTFLSLLPDQAPAES